MLCERWRSWPFGAALRGEASNRHLLRWLKTVVVSEVEKAHVMRQVGTRKTVRSPSLEGSLVTCRYGKGDIKTGCFELAREESGGCPLLGQAVSGM
jgi:hypothetical protein